MIVVVCLNMLLFADQNLMAATLTPIARDFGWLEYYPNGTVRVSACA
jgi:hypothetical protein